MDGPTSFIFVGGWTIHRRPTRYGLAQGAAAIRGSVEPPKPRSGPTAIRARARVLQCWQPRPDDAGGSILVNPASGLGSAPMPTTPSRRLLALSAFGVHWRLCLAHIGISLLLERALKGHEVAPSPVSVRRGPCPTPGATAPCALGDESCAGGAAMRAGQGALRTKDGRRVIGIVPLALLVVVLTAVTVLEG